MRFLHNLTRGESFTATTADVSEEHEDFSSRKDSIEGPFLDGTELSNYQLLELWEERDGYRCLVEYILLDSNIDRTGLEKLSEDLCIQVKKESDTPIFIQVPFSSTLTKQMQTYQLRFIPNAFIASLLLNIDDVFITLVAYSNLPTSSVSAPPTEVFDRIRKSYITASRPEQDVDNRIETMSATQSANQAFYISPQILLLKGLWKNEVPFQSLEKITQFAKGSYADVFSALYKGVKVVVKMIRKSLMTNTDGKDNHN